MKIRAVIDTNVIISALLFGGLPEKVLSLVISKKIELILSPSIRDEIERVLLDPKFSLSTKEVSILLSAIDKVATFVLPSEKITLIKRKDSDNRILEAAVCGNANYIVTGDKQDLLPLKKYLNILIISPKQFLEACQTH
ncbi:MAG: putative toxin-antitoxin system toxin component, PIN family [Bdellovibrionales bacterium RIFOXYD12_FULL_39_22]|nr:MAG: putative toxin-antitoxin system toxin component, PIN family [Bdellovibrionales bacterium RIFOXYB1_FULL_39_21]OFZ47193.1 MAG: putative toxin-antitoxin system toxin component, PIN family [Bdellovibrionales bacterium RIFOXYC1_FULL_39_130]OFZ75032.1 MAG: putative toxin-antitoxin system toxin component, PIN family [Bdellovibrionales bacterium RIFOXYD1_FULL_39_84]OFZ94716.1 MAG: putative toxin-antitoxin system toxin component, PIN family [Bdellovibrionales bacterium RIFOXYD12_FULL_39_22]